MTPMERLDARLDGRAVDRLPNLCIVMGFAARQLDVPYSRYVTDYRVLGEGVVRCHERFGLDCLCVISDPMREAEGFGAEVVIPEDGVPYAPQPRVRGVQDIAGLRPARPEDVPRMLDRIQAVEWLHSQSAGRVPVIGWVEGALAESCDLMGISECMMAMMDEPEAVTQLMELCLEQATRFAAAQVQAGAGIIGVGDAASSLVGPALYEEFALPFQQRLIGNIHAMGARAKLHICGNLNPVLPLVAQTGADIIDLDHMVDMEQAAALFGERAAICGNFDPVAVLYQGTPERVRQAVHRCAEIKDKNRSLMAAGCEVPPHTPPQNLLAVHQTLAAPGTADGAT